VNVREEQGVMTMATEFAEPVQYALFAPNERGIFVRKQQPYTSQMALSKDVHEERLRALREVTAKMAEANKRLRLYLKIPEER